MCWSNESEVDAGVASFIPEDKDKVLRMLFPGTQSVNAWESMFPQSFFKSKKLLNPRTSLKVGLGTRKHVTPCSNLIQCMDY